MRNFSLAVFTFVFIFTSLAAHIHAAQKSKGIGVVIKSPSGKKIELYKGSYALLIGAGNYTAGWPKLECVPGEIDQVEAALENQGFHIKKVIDPTSTQLEAAFEDFIDQYGYDEDNRLLFFFSGHGYSRKGGKKGYLVPVDAPDPRSDKKGFMRKAVGMNMVLTWSRQIETRHALFLFDSCFSGTIFKSKALPKHPPHISDVISRPVRQFISAGSAGEEVPARSVFTPSFIRALNGEGDLDKDGYVTGTEMGMYLHKKVLSYETGQTPQYGKIKDPDLDEGDFVFQLASSSGAIVDEPLKTENGATLSVDSNVSGAKVYIDGRPVGMTDLPEVSVSPGEHRIRVEKDGYETYSRRIDFKSGRSKSLYVGLQKAVPPKGILYVRTEPDEANVQILNIERKFYQGIDLEAGRYQVEVTADGYENKELWVNLGAGDNKEVDVRLTQSAVSSKSSYQVGVSSTKTGQDDRFIAHPNGTVLDTRTNLMWASKDNGYDLNWKDAKKYCKKFRGGGYKDWRMPTQDELASLYDGSKGYQATQRSYSVHLTDLIQLSTGCLWASETRGSEAAYFRFSNGTRSWLSKSFSSSRGALPVRFGN